MDRDPIIVWHPSPNWSERSRPIDKIILHNTAGPYAGALATLCNPRPDNPAAATSAHYLISRVATIFQLVKDEKKAWHARQENSASIGIEIEAYVGATGMTDAQESALLSVIRWLCGKHSLPLVNVFMHRQFVSTECPGFIWPRQADFDRWKNEKGLK